MGTFVNNKGWSNMLVFKNDELKRKEAIEIITNLIKCIEYLCLTLICVFCAIIVYLSFV